MAGFSIWLLAFIDRVVMPLLVRSGVEIIVPDLHLQPWFEADSICIAMNLELDSGKVRIDENIPPNYILDQYPIAGSIVKPGRRIEVILSNHAIRISCPDLIGRSPREAHLIADSSGLIIPKEKVRYRYSRNTPDGVILDQSPVSGTLLDRGDSLSIMISLGPQPQEFIAPDLIGQKIDGIAVLLAKHNLRLGKVSRHPTTAMAPGTVIEQNPEPGTKMSRSGRVNVRVASKPLKDNESGTGTVKSDETEGTRD